MKFFCLFLTSILGKLYLKDQKKSETLSSLRIIEVEMEMFIEKMIGLNYNLILSQLHLNLIEVLYILVEHTNLLLSQKQNIADFNNPLFEN